MGWGGRRNNGRAAWQRIFGYLAPRGAGAPPHLTLGVRYSTVRKGCCRFMAALAKEEKKAPEHRQSKREAEKVDKFEVAPGVTVASLRRSRAALIEP